VLIAFIEAFPLNLVIAFGNVFDKVRSFPEISDNFGDDLFIINS
jgi:hypothetical protein